MSRSIVTLTTDFGSDSPYVAQMKGVLLSINARVALVDITHGVPPQDIVAGSLVLHDVCPRFPVDSIHVAVVDPGVGTGRALIYACVAGRHYLAPDNGLLSCLMQREPPSVVLRLTSKEYWRDRISATFHGRDILAPVAGHLSLGLDPLRLGPVHNDPACFTIPPAQRTGQQVRGQVISIDSFGNLVTNVEESDLPESPLRAKCRVLYRGCELPGVLTTYGEGTPGEAIALVGSSGRLEIAVVCGSAAQRLSARIGDEVRVLWPHDQ